jgi:hypothetical protein
LLQVVELNQVDTQRDQEIKQACAQASSDVCRAEVDKLKTAFESYDKARINGELLQDQTLGEYLSVAMQYGDLRSVAMEENAKTALVNMPVDAVNGAVDLSVIVTKAAIGDDQAQQQLSFIADGIKEFIKDPLNVTEAHILGRLAEADQLEAAGKINEADQIRSQIVLQGMFAITGVSGSVASLASTPIRITRVMDSGKNSGDITPEGSFSNNASNANAPGNQNVGKGGSTGSESSTIQNADVVPEGAGTPINQYSDGSFRTPDGKFASQGGLPAPGTKSAQEYTQFLRNNGFEVVGEELTVKGAVGNRRYDAVVRTDKGELWGIEYKSGGATKTPQQNFNDMYINKFGANGVGQIAGEKIIGNITIYLP